MSMAPTDTVARTDDELPTPLVDDIWQEQDPRHPRFVKVIRVGTKGAFIQAVELDIVNGWLPVKNEFTGRDAPIRESQLKRFNGKRSGYKLYERDGVVS